jgi:hypothetical protein
VKLRGKWAVGHSDSDRLEADNTMFTRARRNDAKILNTLDRNLRSNPLQTALSCQRVPLRRGARTIY